MKHLPNTKTIRDIWPPGTHLIHKSVPGLQIRIKGWSGCNQWLKEKKMCWRGKGACSTEGYSIKGRYRNTEEHGEYCPLLSVWIKK